jgi:hypothetical protein
LTSVALGFQSVDQLKTALKAKNGVNVQQFIKSFQNFGTALSDLTGLSETRANTEGFDVIEVDAVVNDGRNHSAETPDRRVQNGQTYQEFIHNLPDLISLNCYLQDGRNYTGVEFEEVLTNVMERKVAIGVILGDERKEDFVITNFAPNRSAMGGYDYSLELKKIEVGSVELVSLSLSDVAKSSVAVIKSKMFNKDTKTDTETSQGQKKSRSLGSTTLVGELLQ